MVLERKDIRVTARSRLTHTPKFCTDRCLPQTITLSGLLLNLSPSILSYLKMDRRAATLQKVSTLWKFLGSISLCYRKLPQKHRIKENRFLRDLTNMHQNINAGGSVWKPRGMPPALYMDAHPLSLMGRVLATT